MVRSTLEEWTALVNGDRGTLLRVRATNHMAMAATTVATTAPPTASAWLVQRPPGRAVGGDQQPGRGGRPRPQGQADQQPQVPEEHHREPAPPAAEGGQG